MGQRTLVVDEADKVGGAWRECSAMGIDGVEIGPHVITFNADTYDYFARELGIEMTALHPVPVYLLKTPFGLLRLPYHLSPFVSYLAVPYHFFANAAYRARLSELREEYLGRLGDALRLTCRWLFSAQAPRLLYPRGGTVELMRSITTELEGAGVEIALGTRVQSLRRCADGSVLAELGDRTVHAGHVLMTVHQHLEKIADNVGEHALALAPRRHTILHMLIKSALPQRITFALAKRNPVFNLISKIAPYLPEPLDPDRRLLAVRLVNWDVPRDRAEVEKFVRSLRESTIIAPDAELLDFQFSEYDQTCLTRESQALVRRILGQSVTILRSTNFANSIGDQVKRWRTLRPAV